MNSQNYKLVFTVPSTHANAVRVAIGEAGAGRLGNYSFCSFTTKGIGRFRPENGAKPVIGEIGRLEEVEEEKVECQCDGGVLDAVLAALRHTHPYEEIAYDVWKLENR